MILNLNCVLIHTYTFNPRPRRMVFGSARIETKKSNSVYIFR